MIVEYGFAIILILIIIISIIIIIIVIIIIIIIKISTKHKAQSTKQKGYAGFVPCAFARGWLGPEEVKALGFCAAPSSLEAAWPKPKRRTLRSAKGLPVFFLLPFFFLIIILSSFFACSVRKKTPRERCNTPRTIHKTCTGVFRGAFCQGMLGLANSWGFRIRPLKVIHF